jgi:hypothetical protein
VLRTSQEYADALREVITPPAHEVLIAGIVRFIS